MESRPGSPAAKADAAAPDLDPVYQWVDGDGRYLLHLNLPGFKKEDFRVHVDPAGRLNILGHRTADGGAGNVRLHKVFQLPSTSDLDAITGRYDGSVLTLTVPKLPSALVLPPPQAPKEEVHKEPPNDDVADKPTDKKSEVSRKAERLIEAARARLQGRRKEETSKEKTAMRSMEEVAATKVDERKLEPKATPTEKVMNEDDDQDQEEKAKAAQHKEKLECEAARARLHAAARETETQREKTGCWTERAVEEGFKWADAIGKNKEVIATAVAAFTLGVFVSHRLFSRN